MSENNRPEPNAHFYYFKETGKYYYDAEGYLPEAVFEPYYQGGVAARTQILAANNGKMPGLSNSGSEMHVFVVLKDSNAFGWPIMLKAL